MRSLDQERRGPPSTDRKADDCNVIAPAITIYVDLDEWDARAKSLGGNSHSLVAGFARETRRTHGTPARRATAPSP